MKTTDLLVARVTLLLVGRSRRWLAPALLYLLWVGLVLANPGPVRANAVAVFPLFEVIACWFAIIVGNADDDGHRELCTALAGSAGRIVIVRATSAIAVSIGLAIVTTVLLGALSSPRSLGATDEAPTFALLLAATLFGAGIGAVLHRPVVRNAGLTVVLAALGLLAALIVPPVIAALRATVDGSDTGAYALVLASLLFVVVAIALGSRLATRLR